MANWLERAKRDIPQDAGRVTAKTDERNLMAVTAVPGSGDAEISRASVGSTGSAAATGFPVTEAVPMTAGEESSIRAWLAQIEETDETIIAHVLNQCRTEPDARGYFIRRSQEAPRPTALDDDRRRCDQCANLTGRGICLAARRGEIVASRTYEPVRALLRRCEGYTPWPDDPDRRPGRERWPGLIQEGGANDREQTEEICFTA